MKNLILLRGVPGAGKTTTSTLFLGCASCDDTITVAADDYMVDEDGNYEYDFNKLKECHKLCQDEVRNSLQTNSIVVVHNTFCADWEMDAYYKIAEEVGDCRVYSMIVENRHGSKSIHDVPDDKIEMMKTKLMDNIKL